MWIIIIHTMIREKSVKVNFLTFGKRLLNETLSLNGKI